MRLSLFPRSLAGRTILILLIGFSLVQLLGLTIHTFNQISLARIEDERSVATRAVIIYRHIASVPPDDRQAQLAREPLPRGDKLTLTGSPFPPDAYDLPISSRQIIRGSFIAYGMPPGIRPRAIEIRALKNPDRYVLAFALSDGNWLGTLLPGFPPDAIPPSLLPPPPPFSLLPPDQRWLVLTSPMSPSAPWRSPSFASAFVVMFVLGAIIIVWAVRKLLVPVRTLAAAAEQLGRDVVSAPALPEEGPSEIVTAAIAFNTMAARIRRFIEDRTFLLTAVGHDLRTPITRLKLRAEYMDDDEQRQKMLADLDEMEAMVAATLAFGRDITTSEPLVMLDLPILLRTILDEAADGDPDHADVLDYTGPDHLPIHARPLGLKRALTNLIGNALKYGDAARISLSPPVKDMVQVNIDDDGPGIAAHDSETVFEPFRRLETSRNRETGGSGLGLSIARNIIRAHGGDIKLCNREEGGLRASVVLPI